MNDVFTTGTAIIDWLDETSEQLRKQRETYERIFGPLPKEENKEGA